MDITAINIDTLYENTYSTHIAQQQHTINKYFSFKYDLQDHH